MLLTDKNKIISWACHLTRVSVVDIGVFDIAWTSWTALVMKSLSILLSMKKVTLLSASDSSLSAEKFILLMRSICFSDKLGPA